MGRSVRRDQNLARSSANFCPSLLAGQDGREELVEMEPFRLIRAAAADWMTVQAQPHTPDPCLQAGLPPDVTAPEASAPRWRPAARPATSPRQGWWTHEPRWCDQRRQRCVFPAIRAAPERSVGHGQVTGRRAVGGRQRAGQVGLRQAERSSAWPACRRNARKGDDHRRGTRLIPVTDWRRGSRQRDIRRSMAAHHTQPRTQQTQPICATNSVLGHGVAGRDQRRCG